MKLIGNWSDPLPYESEKELETFKKMILDFQCTCQFCGTKTFLSSKKPLGFFNVCIRERSIANEPANWVVLCDMCVCLNSLDNLKGKGSFIEAGWIKQSKLTNLIRLSYAVTLLPDGDWKGLSKAAPAFLNSIDTIPDSWAEIGWDGSVEQLIEGSNRTLHPFNTDSYINSFRFRYDLDPFKEAITYWFVQLESLAVSIDK